MTIIFVTFKKLLVMKKRNCNKVTYRDLRIQSNYQKYFEVFLFGIGLPTTQKITIANS